MRASRRTAAALLISGAALVTACGDAPHATAPAPTLAIGVGHLEGITSFMVHPGRATSQLLGEHRIKFDADAICDPRTSTYGPGEWDAPCEVARSPVRVTATTWRDANGRPRVDFEPALRFHPDANVTLYLMDREASADTANATIYWVDPLGNLVDESLTDPSVATYVGPNGFLFRRLKHFSGYVIVIGRESYESSESSELY